MAEMTKSGRRKVRAAHRGLPSFILAAENFLLLPKDLLLVGHAETLANVRRSRNRLPLHAMCAAHVRQQANSRTIARPGPPTSLRVVNRLQTSAAFRVRAYAWSAQSDSALSQPSSPLQSFSVDDKGKAAREQNPGRSRVGRPESSEQRARGKCDKANST